MGLVIAMPRRAPVHADGQANGGGGVDKFRIKIWDNQIGDADDSDATQAIVGGSIVIHSK